MQGDGNFVVYDGGTAKWSTATAGTGANRLVMQGDGNLVLYAGNIPKWSSNTAGTGTTKLVVQDDGNLVLYENDRATWSWRDGYLGADLRSVNTLRPGVTLWSPNHRFGAVMQGDGNFVVYDGGTAKWSTATGGTGANRLVMQADGNLVVYAGNTPKWSSNTAGTGTNRLVMQDDGNLVLYENDRATWSWRDGYLGADLRSVNTLRPGVTLWSPNHRFGAVMQGDGNFVVYDGGTAKWSTATAGTGANRLVMQGDGNLVLYAGNTPKWSSNTAGTGTTRLVMQDDGNLVLYSASAATWSIYSSPGGGMALMIPFPQGQSWYICQGYNGVISHSGHPSLDLTTYPGRGGSGCYGGDNAAAGGQVLSPGPGYARKWDASHGGVCVTLDAGGSFIAYHLLNRIADGRVSRGQQLGTVAPAGQANNGNYAHAHIEMHSAGCSSSTIPFSGTARFEGAPDLTYSGAANQWAGTALTRN